MLTGALGIGLDRMMINSNVWLLKQGVDRYLLRIPLIPPWKEREPSWENGVADEL
jgi:hypothetical protein